MLRSALRFCFSFCFVIHSDELLLLEENVENKKERKNGRKRDGVKKTTAADASSRKFVQFHKRYALNSIFVRYAKAMKSNYIEKKKRFRSPFCFDEKAFVRSKLERLPSLRQRRRSSTDGFDIEHMLRFLFSLN